MEKSRTMTLDRIMSEGGKKINGAMARKAEDGTSGTIINRTDQCRNTDQLVNIDS